RNRLMNDLISEVARFRHWAAPYPYDRGPWWECDYEYRLEVCDVVMRFLHDRPFASWTDEEINAVLYALARDNELQHKAMVLWGLHRTDSPHLETLLAEAEKDERPLLCELAKKVRRGEVDP